MGRTHGVIRAGIAALALTVFPVVAAVPSVSAPSEPKLRYPDLGMARVTVVELDETTMPGHRLLRYTARIVNVGRGVFEVVGTRDSTLDSHLALVQRVGDDSGGTTDLSITGGTMLWAGDGHNHWHISDLESGSLRAMDGSAGGALAKHGFHIVDAFGYDLTLPGAPQHPVYRNNLSPESSSLDPDALEVTEGLSVGWGDIYAASTNLQWIDVTDLPAGRYKLRLAVNADHAFRERYTDNNATWAVIRLWAHRAVVLNVGPDATGN